MDDEIRLYAERALAEQFPQLNVSIGGARLVEGRGIAVYDLAISETTSTQLQNNLLVIDEIMLVCDAQLSKLMQGIPTIRRVVVKHPQVWVARKSDERWNIESLLPLPTFGGTCPQIVIKDAHIAIYDQRQAQMPPFALHEVNVTVNPLSRKPRTNAESAPSGIQPLEIHGTWGGPDLRHAEIHARVDPAEKSLFVTAKIEQLQITPKLRAWVSAYAPGSLSQLRLQGRVDGNIRVKHQFGVGAVPQVESHLKLVDGRFEDPRLPRPLTELTCDVACDNGGVKVKELRGKLGSAQVAMQLERHGWKSTSPLAMGLKLENVPLDGSLYESLPEFVQRQWDKYQPAGLVDGQLQLTFDGVRWRPALTLTGRALAFESDKFRYRVNDGSGTLRYTPSEGEHPARLDIDLIGHGGGQPLKIVGQVFDPRPGALGWVEITGQNVEIEQRMIDALPEKTRRVIQSIHPTGKFHVRWHLARKEEGQLTPNTTLRLELVDCQVKYEKFPYPLRGIHGLILAENKRWTFRDLASSGSRSVQCQGYLQPEGAGNELSLQFAGQQISLDDDLQQALPESVRKAWTEIRPRGRVDLIANIKHETGYEAPSIRVTVHPRPESTTIQPKFFPYLLEQVEGTFNYQDGELQLANVRARHGRTTVRSNGSGSFSKDGSWYVQLEGLSVDRLAARRDLIVALPSKLQKLLDDLKPTGGFGLQNGRLRFSKSREAEAPIDSQWDIELDCHQTDLQVGIELRNVHGSVRLQGASVDGRCQSKGELALDSVTFENVQFTQIRGPIWVDETSCRLGRWATDIQRLPTRRLTAKVYNGDLVGDGWATFDGLPEYGAQASLAGADLLRMMTERFNSQRPFRGNIAANINLRGRGRSLDNLVGNGDIKITDANIYELPLLVGLLKVLRNSTPDSTAFNQSDMKFRIQGRHIDLDQLDFLGDVVSLYGKGYTNFDHQLKLVFHGVVGRNDFRLPFVKNFVGNASQQIMQMYVEGTMADPQVHTQVFPGFNNLFQQIQADLETNGVVNGPREAKRGGPRGRQ